MSYNILYEDNNQSGTYQWLGRGMLGWLLVQA